MKQVKVVIGANFGDEGKGLMTDYFAAQANDSIVVRFNGGAQAGHTVVTTDNREHVFSHFGSGTLNFIPTYLSEFFIVNPLLFRSEYEKLSALSTGGVLPHVFVDGDCLVTTPYDMIINQIIETLRGNSRHGSCGLGINETIRRTEDFDGRYKLYIHDIYDESLLRIKLEAIKSEYVPQRLADLGVTDIPDIFGTVLEDYGIIESFIIDCGEFLSTITVTDLNVLNLYGTIVFEGAQGLLLDQNSEYFPYVTHSNTGMVNVAKILEKVQFQYDIEITYVTRCYTTRHGAGAFPTETATLPYSKIVDTTNIPNTWQGSLRFGLVDLTSLQEHIVKDLQVSGKEFFPYSLAITCLDQIDDKVNFVVSGETHSAEIGDFLHYIHDTFDEATRIYGSWGRTRGHVQQYY
jgi:adenylosuccinate synthase